MSQPRATTSDLVRQYARKQRLYSDLAKQVEALLRSLLKQEGIKTQMIASRGKTRSSLRAKLKGDPKRYRKLNDVTDLAAARVITYFDDDVDRVADVVRKHFEIDEENSIDKREAMDPDRFGYLSLHFVVTLGGQRANLGEYARFNGVPVEIQIRSVLQHAWAEIEHDLGYKVKETIPREHRRCFARVASLLEIADSEFRALRDGLGEYADAVKDRIAESPEETGIDRESVLSLIESSHLVRGLDEQIVRAAGREAAAPPEEYVDRIVKAIHWVRLATVSDVQQALQEHGHPLVSLAAGLTYLRNPWDSPSRGISLDMLAAYLALRSGADVATLHGEAFEVDPASAEIYAADFQRAYEGLSPKQ